MIIDEIPTAPFTEDVVVARRQGVAVCNVPCTVIFKRWDGYNFGYVGHAPAELAVNILNAFVPPRRREAAFEPGPVRVLRGMCSVFAAENHIAFMYDFLVRMDRETGGTIPAHFIVSWIEQKRAEREEAAREAAHLVAYRPRRRA